MKTLLALIILSISAWCCNDAEQMYSNAVNSNRTITTKGIDLTEPDKIKHTWDWLVLDYDENGYLTLYDFK